MSEDTHEQDNHDSPNFRMLREKNETLENEVATLKSALRFSAFKEAGINPEEGIGKAVYRTYDGEISPDSIRSFAEQEYGIQIESEPVVSTAQANTDQVLAGAVSPGEKSALQMADEAAREGDWVKAQALKDAELRRIAQARFGV